MAEIVSKTTSRATGDDRPDAAWFLQHSSWHDTIWVFAPTTQSEETRPVRIYWDFVLPSGRRSTDAQYASLLECVKRLISLLRTRSPYTGLAQRAKSVAADFDMLRQLIRWMDEEGFTRFADLDSDAILRFRTSITRRKGTRGPRLTPTTVRRYLHLLVQLYRLRDDIGDGLQVDPCEGQRTSTLAGIRQTERARLPYTPDSVAVPLIQGAIKLLATGAIDILRARELYTQTITQAQLRGCGRSACEVSALRAVRRQVTLNIFDRSSTINSLSDLALLIDMLYAACFIVISYLVGPRVSEILRLQVGCVQLRAAPEVLDASSNHSQPSVQIVGAIFKQEAYRGRPHAWVAPSEAVHAVAVLEALSAPHRIRTGRSDLWLRTRGNGFGAREWWPQPPDFIELPGVEPVNRLLNRFGAWLDLPQHGGKVWRLSTHQGRKTFARFAALRDRTALFALAQHLGHRDRTITDQSYAGNDYRLNREIDAEILEQSQAAWEHMLAAPGLGGRAGAEILAKRPRFRGARMKQDLKSYARMLTEAGLALGVCEWGFCVYRQEHSACLGNANGPNPVHREPSTCARCKNFAVSRQHRPYWVEQVLRHEALLNEPALPTQTLKIARERLGEALALIRSIDADTKADSHGNPAPDNKTTR